MTKPIMKAQDKTFSTGYVGFGSFDDTGKYRSIHIYAPDFREKTTDVFKGPVK